MNERHHRRARVRRGCAGSALGQTQELELGYFARGDQVAASQQRHRSGDRRTPTRPIPTSSRSSATSASTPMPTCAPLPWLGLRGGLRGDLFTFDVNDLCAVHDVSRPSKTNPPGDASCLDQQNFGAAPRAEPARVDGEHRALAARVALRRALRRTSRSRASYGEGIRSIDPGYITQDVKTPVRQHRRLRRRACLRAATVGDVELVARSVLFQTHVDSDLIFSETAGRNVLGDGTTRTGWVGAARVTGSFFDEAANLTLVRSTYDDTHLLVAYVPDVVLRSDTALFHELPLSIAGQRIRKGRSGTGLTYVGRRPLPLRAAKPDRSSPPTPRPRSAGPQLRARAHRRPTSSINATGSGEYNFASDFKTRAAADAGADAPFHGRRAPRHLRHFRGELRGQMNEPSRVRARGCFGVTFTLALVLEACSGTTGGEVIAFRAAASGPRDASRAARLDERSRVDVTLTAATLHVGAIYLNQTVKVSGAQETGCILPGTYVAQVTTGRDVDLLSPEPQPFPAPGEGDDAPGPRRSSLAHRGAHRSRRRSHADSPRRGGRRGGRRGAPVLGHGDHRIQPRRDGRRAVQAGASLICNSGSCLPSVRRSRSTRAGALLLRVDPRLLFTNVDFGGAASGRGRLRVLRRQNAQDQPSRNFYLNLRAAGGAYSFEWLP